VKQNIGKGKATLAFMSFQRVQIFKKKCVKCPDENITVP
jgi:hypothetical protein